MAKKQTKKEPTAVSCVECANATLMQWGDDPLIADCTAHRCREVASHKRTCKDFIAEMHLPKSIRHLVKRAGLQIKEKK